MAYIAGKYAWLPDGSIVFVSEEDAASNDTWIFTDGVVEDTGWTGKICGVTNPSKICGVAVADVDCV